MDITKFIINPEDEDKFLTYYYSHFKDLSEMNRFQNWFFGIVTDFNAIPDFNEDAYLKLISNFLLDYGNFKLKYSKIENVNIKNYFIIGNFIGRKRNIQISAFKTCIKHSKLFSAQNKKDFNELFMIIDGVFIPRFPNNNLIHSQVNKNKYKNNLSEKYCNSDNNYPNYINKNNDDETSTNLTKDKFPNNNLIKDTIKTHDKELIPQDLKNKLNNSSVINNKYVNLEIDNRNNLLTNEEMKLIYAHKLSFNLTLNDICYSLNIVETNKNIINTKSNIDDNNEIYENYEKSLPKSYKSKTIDSTNSYYHCVGFFNPVKSDNPNNITNLKTDNDNNLNNQYNISNNENTNNQPTNASDINNRNIISMQTTEKNNYSNSDDDNEQLYQLNKNNNETNNKNQDKKDDVISEEQVDYNEIFDDQFELNLIKNTNNESKLKINVLKEKLSEDILSENIFANVIHNGEKLEEKNIETNNNNNEIFSETNNNNNNSFILVFNKKEINYLPNFLNKKTTNINKFDLLKESQTVIYSCDSLKIKLRINTDENKNKEENELKLEDVFDEDNSKKNKDKNNIEIRKSKREVEKISNYRLISYDNVKYKRFINSKEQVNNQNSKSKDKKVLNKKANLSKGKKGRIEFI